MNRDNALPDLIRLANYARMRLNAEAIPDPEEGAHVPLHPVTRGHQVRFERVVDSLRADPGERVPEEEPRTSRGKGQGVSRSSEGHAISSRSTSDCQTTGARVGSEADTHEAGCAGGSPGGDQPAHGTTGNPPRQARDVDQSDFDSEARLEYSMRPRAALQDSYEHDVGPYDSEQPGDDKCCDCLEVTSDDLDGLSVDAFARRLWQIKDFGHASCEKILKHVCSECQAARKRKDQRGDRQRSLRCVLTWQSLRCHSEDLHLPQCLHLHQSFPETPWC